MEKSKTNKELPKFKYFEDPYKLNIIKRDDNIRCHCCNKLTGYNYEGVIYSVHDVSNVCPWCIANGAVGEKYDATFHDCVYDESQLFDKSSVSEVMERTPGFPTWQPFTWPIRDGDFCMYVGDIGWDEIKVLPDSEDVIRELHEHIKESYGTTNEEEIRNIMESITNVGTHSGYLFKSVVTNKHVVIEDWD